MTLAMFPSIANQHGDSEGNGALVLRLKVETAADDSSYGEQIFGDDTEAALENLAPLSSSSSPSSIYSSSHSHYNLQLLTPPTSPPSPKPPHANLADLWQPTSLARSSPVPSPFELHRLTVQHATILTHIKSHPYDPRLWLTLTAIYHRLGYSDLYTSTAHRALMLILAGLSIHNEHFPADALLAKNVRDTVRIRTGNIEDELEETHLEARQALLSGLLDCGAWYEALMEGKIAQKWFPEDEDLTYLLGEAKGKYLDAIRGSAAEEAYRGRKGGKSAKAGRVGRVGKKGYPWLSSTLFRRSKNLLREIQRDFDEGNGNRASKSTIRQLQNVTNADDDDVGPLGVFATADIKKGEVILVDQGVTFISNTLPWTLTNCGACHASLSPLHIPRSQVLTPSCCSDVAFCSSSCLHQATCETGYHRTLCGQDFRWLYDTVAKGLEGKNEISWQQLLFLRIVAVVLGRMAGREANKHPLEHPLLAKLAAGYSDKGRATWASSVEWTYKTHVIAPTRILAQLGVDVFADPLWSPEVVQTIFVRILNNMCSIGSVTVVEGVARRCDLVGIGGRFAFFNHSCEPNVGWGRGREVDEIVICSGESVRLRAGCSALVCRTLKEVKEGEELRISYLPRRIGREELGKWFDGGCGCTTCEGESVNESG